MSSSVFSDPCPGTEKYVEVHYYCTERHSVTTQRYPLPPWYQDLRATFQPGQKSSSVTTTEREGNSDNKTEAITESQSTSTKPPKSGRYYVISEDSIDDDTELTVILLACLVSAILTVLAIFLLYHIVRRLEVKIRTQCEPSHTTEQHSADSRFLETHTEYDDRTLCTGAMSLPYLSTVYSEPEDRRTQAQSLSAVIGSDNYVIRSDNCKQMIMHTVAQGDNGDIRVIKPGINNLWASNPALSGHRKAGPLHIEKMNSVSGLSPIHISFSQTGKHFVNLNLHSE